MHQLFIDFKKTYASVRRDILYNIRIQFGITMKQARLIKMCLTETYNRFREGKYLPHMFPIKNVLEKGDALSLLLSNFPLEYAIRRVRVNQDGFKVNGTHQLVVYADDVKMSGGSVLTIKKNTEALVVASKKQMLIKLSTWSCLEIRMQDEVTV